MQNVNDYENVQNNVKEQRQRRKNIRGDRPSRYRIEESVHNELQEQRHRGGDRPLSGTC